VRIRAAVGAPAALLVLLLAGCAGSAEPDAEPPRGTAPPSSPAAGEDSEAIERPEPGFPGLSCDAIISSSAASEVVGRPVDAPETHVPDPVILQDNGIECSWGTSTVVDGFDVAREAPAIVLRATPHGTDYWQGYVSGSGHNQWDDTLGDASGVVCEPGTSAACTLSMLSGDVFVEISAFGMVAGPEGAGAALRELGATALPVLVGSAAPVQASRPAVRHRTERCRALVGPLVDSAGAGLAPDTVPGRSMTNTAIDLVGSTVCTLDFGDARIELLVVQGGRWMVPETDGAHRIRFDDGTMMESLAVADDLVQVRWDGAAGSRHAPAVVEFLVARYG
jgi:hypothetical protein